MNQSIAQRVTGILSLVSGAAALLTASAAVLGDRLFAYFFFPHGIAASSIGIIGGADGPTAIFVTTRIADTNLLVRTARTAFRRWLRRVLPHENETQF